MFFTNSLAFSMIQRMLAIWSLVPLPFLKPAWTSGSSWFTYCWSLGLENFEHYFTGVWDECNCAVVWVFFGIAFLWDWNDIWPSVVFNSVQPHRWQPTRLPCPWDSPGKYTGVGCHFLLQCMQVKSESEVAQTGLEKVSFHSNPKERQCQRILKLPHNCTHLIC